jgi:phosphatidylglycerol lysyltransferase
MNQIFQNPGRLPDAWVKNRHWMLAVASVALFALALWVLHRELASMHVAGLRLAMGRMGAGNLLLALACTAVSYWALTGYDVLALRYLNRSLPYRRVALASFIATAVGHNLGMAVVSGGAVRARLYTSWGLGATEVAGMVAFVGMTLGVGLTFTAGLAMVFEPARASQLLFLSRSAVQALGGLLLLGATMYVVLGAVRKAPFAVGSWRFRLPGASTALQQLGLAVVDIAAGATVLYVLLPPHGSLSWPVFVGAYVLAVVAGIASHVPGGLGVFETVMLLALPDVPREDLLAAIVVYRAIYYLVPLGTAGVLAALLAVRERRERLAQGVAQVRRVFAWLAPTAASSAVFVAGALLLFSGSLPAESSRLRVLHGLMPLPVLEVSHLAGSLVGLGLLILAQGLYRRVDVSYRLALWLLAGGALVSLLKGLDYEEATVALTAMGILWLGRDAFHRRAALMSGVWSPAWLIGVLLVLVATLWLGMFSYRHVEYSQELWWHFALRSDAPRYLRASLVLMVAATALVVMRWMQPQAPEPGQPDERDLERAARIVAASPQAEAALALTGDKRLLFSEKGDAFLMYQVRGQSWIAMGDPVGDPGACEALIWRLRELADQHGGRVVFYQVDASKLWRYLDMGLSAVKLGEEAMVPLEGFSLYGSSRSALRHAHSRAAREGLQFEVVSLTEHPDWMDELHQVSDAWLGDKHTREKGFSLGFFEPEYLRRFPCAVVRQEGRIVAFANLWASAGKQELSVDLMRYVPGASKALMDFLFAELMLWGAREGYRHFSMGMAPLSGLEDHPLAPLWHRMGTLLFRHGEHFYNFQGLRAYKAKFDPEWRPKYLVAPGGLGLPAVFLDVAALIAGGLRGIVAR